VYQAAVTMLQS